MKLDDIFFLTEEDIRRMHGRALAAQGEADDGVREPHTLSSCAAAPEANARNGYITTLADIGATYAYGFARTQAFVDGNKRTAVLAMKAFLEANNHPLNKLDANKWEAIIRNVAEGFLSRDELAERIAEEMGSASGAQGPVWSTIDTD